MLKILGTSHARIVTTASLLIILAGGLFRFSPAVESDSMQTVRDRLFWYSIGLGGSNLYFWNLDLSLNLELNKGQMLTARMFSCMELVINYGGGSADYNTADYARDFEILYGRFIYTKHTHVSFSTGVSYFNRYIYDNCVEDYIHHEAVGLPIYIQSYLTWRSPTIKEAWVGIGLCAFANLNAEKSFYGLTLSSYVGNNVQPNDAK